LLGLGQAHCGDCVSDKRATALTTSKSDVNYEDAKRGAELGLRRLDETAGLSY
jgi:hypothetical protein